jgi:hypothetical protein
LSKAEKGKPSAIQLMIGNPNMPEDLLEVLAQRLPEKRTIIFSNPVASEALIRASFEEELVKETKSQRSAIMSMIHNPHMPVDLLERVAASDLPLITVANARGELARRAAKRPPGFAPDGTRFDTPQ